MKLNVGINVVFKTISSIINYAIFKKSSKCKTVKQIEFVIGSKNLFILFASFVLGVSSTSRSLLHK